MRRVRRAHPTTPHILQGIDYIDALTDKNINIINRLQLNKTQHPTDRQWGLAILFHVKLPDLLPDNADRCARYLESVGASFSDRNDASA